MPVKNTATEATREDRQKREDRKEEEEKEEDKEDLEAWNEFVHSTTFHGIRYVFDRDFSTLRR